MASQTPVLDEITNKVVEGLNQDKENPAVFDPSALIAFFKQIIALFQGCGATPSQAEFRAQHINDRGFQHWNDRRILRKRAQRFFSSQEQENTIVGAVESIGQDLTVAQFTALYAEVRVKK